MTITTKERETLRGQMDLIDKVLASLGDLPHKLAVPAIHDLTELRNALCEALPGYEFFCNCESCKLPLGVDDDMATSEDGVTICGDCLKQYERAA